MLYDKNILDQYLENGLIEKNPHPDLPIDIYNYTRKCQYESSWDEITLNMRGTVIDRKGQVIAKPFKKFFNLEEHKCGEIPDQAFDVFEKLDGSLGILFCYQGEWILATKGSFSSDQALKGIQLLKKYDYRRLISGYTYLFEIIYPENQIVCQYNFEDLILLAIFENASGEEIYLHDEGNLPHGNRVRNLCLNIGFKTVKKYDGIQDYSKLKTLIPEDKEGYVIRFRNGFRMKIKGDEYVRLHRLLTGFSNIDIWEYLRNGKPLNNLLEKVPDEFDDWVKATVTDLNYSKMLIQEHSGKLYDSYIENLSGPPHYGEPPSRKEIANWVMKQEEFLRPILFKMFDGKDYSNYIWKLIRPKHQKPFWQRKDE